MSTEIIIVALLGVVAAVVMFSRNTQDVKKDRQSAIEEKVKGIGGEIVGVEQVDRAECPYSEEFHDYGSIYKFYRINYAVDDHGKSGYGVLILKHNKYGPALAANTKWQWYF